MRISFFSAHGYERGPFEAANQQHGHQLHFLEARLTVDTAPLANGAEAVCAFVTDQVSGPVLEQLKKQGVKLVLLRSAGFDNVDLTVAERLGLPVLRVPEYSPHAVAEHAFALLLGLNRKIPQARARVREGNFSLDRLVGFDLCGKTFGVVGTGRIGGAAARIARGFGCRVLAYDLHPDAGLAKDVGLKYVQLEELLKESDIVSLHVPLSTESRYLMNERTLKLLKRGAVLVNTSRGALVDTPALLEALKSGHLKGAALDVYEGESDWFFRDRSGEIIADETLMWLVNLPNVLITAHQGFLTDEALSNIATTTLSNAAAFQRGESLPNRVLAGTARPPRT